MTFANALFIAIGALSTVIVTLWRGWQNERVRADSDRKEADDDRKEATRLIFALLGERARILGVSPPKTASTPAAPMFSEAKSVAASILNGDVEQLLREFLESDAPPPIMRPPPLRKR